MRTASLLFLFFYLSAAALKAQTSTVRRDSAQQKTTAALTAYYKKLPHEKVYVQTDRNIYVGGETLWYSTFDVAYGNPSQLSGIVYLQLSDVTGKIVLRQKRPVKKGSAFGSVTVPDNLSSGWYCLRAFTVWMLNFEREEIGQKFIFIKNPRDQLSGAAAKTRETHQYKISFFAEGGHMVNGTICNIAFKATDENGLPARVRGEIIGEAKAPAVHFSSVHDGMGCFELETYSAVKYFARVHFPDSSVQTVPLPAVEKTGVSLRVKALLPNELQVKIAYNSEVQEDKNIFIALVQDNGLHATYPITMSGGTNMISIKTPDFSTGVARLTLFDETGQPLAERLLFINHNDQLSATITAYTLARDSSGKNIFTVHVSTRTGLPEKIKLSIAVTDATRDDGADNIYSYLLLSSELSGYIHHPKYYFQNNSDTLKQQLDLVMLTNTWRHFSWAKVTDLKLQVLKYAAERSQFIAGKIAGYNAKDDMAIKLMIAGQGSQQNLVVIKPDSSGVFKLDEVEGDGDATIFYQAVIKKGTAAPVKVTFFNRSADSLNAGADAVKWPPMAPPDSGMFLNRALSLSTGKMLPGAVNLDSVIIKGHKTTPTELLIKNHVKRLGSENAESLDVINSPTVANQNIIDYITGRFPGLMVYNPPSGDVVFQYRGASDLPLTQNDGKTPLLVSKKPYVYVNEALSDVSDIKDIPLVDVALIQYVPPPVWFAPLNGGFEGALLVYTKTHGDEVYATRQNDTGAKNKFERYAFSGYSVVRDDYVPNRRPDQTNGPAPGGPTLYWAHDAETDENGNVKIRVYNSVSTRKFRVTIQGMDDSGNLVSLEQLIPD